MWAAKTPDLFKPLASDMVWDIHPVTNEVFLTFDDGPTPGVTDHVLDMLAEVNAKATFFCLGKNVQAEPDLAVRIQNEGHVIGNHTYDHVSGWKTPDLAFFRSYLRTCPTAGTRLFRPPYGQITPAQAALIARRSHVVMWDVLGGDFDAAATPEACVRNVCAHAGPGSIIVLHDSQKAWPVLRIALPEILTRLTSEGYALRALTEAYLPLKPERSARARVRLGS